MSWSELGEVCPWYEELPPERWNEGQPHLTQGRTWTWRDEEEERWRRELNRLEEWWPTEDEEEVVGGEEAGSQVGQELAHPTPLDHDQATTPQAAEPNREAPPMLSPPRARGYYPKGWNSYWEARAVANARERVYWEHWDPEGWWKPEMEPEDWNLELEPEDWGVEPEDVEADPDPWATYRANPKPEIDLADLF